MKQKILTAKDASRELRKRGDKEKARGFQRFFRTGKGEYGEGDVFVGVTVPMVNVVSKQFGTLPLREVSALLHSSIHEERLLALKIAVHQFAKGTPKQQEEIYRFYKKHFQRINNWDLVDASAYHIVGTHLLNQNRDDLYVFARSKNLWIKRIAIVSTFAFIRKGQLEDTLRISSLLISDSHDLIHKACGWMLREVGKRDIKTLKLFLDTHAFSMPRTMLRYAIEKMTEKERKHYLALR